MRSSAIVLFGLAAIIFALVGCVSNETNDPVKSVSPDVVVQPVEPPADVEPPQPTVEEVVPKEPQETPPTEVVVETAQNACLPEEQFDSAMAAPSAPSPPPDQGTGVQTSVATTQTLEPRTTEPQTPTQAQTPAPQAPAPQTPAQAPDEPRTTQRSTLSETLTLGGEGDLAQASQAATEVFQPLLDLVRDIGRQIAAWYQTITTAIRDALAQSDLIDNNDPEQIFTVTGIGMVVPLAVSLNRALL